MIPFYRPMGAVAPAKLNIRLKITGRRSDGYHELSSIMVPVNLFDQLDLQFIEAPGIEISCRRFPELENSENLVCRAAQAFFSKTGWQKGVSITLDKQIPVAAGLGGGSSDAAAVLMALNESLPDSHTLSFDDLAKLALNLGADVPFFLHRGPCLAQGIGEILKPLPEWPTIHFVVVMPGISVSTAWVYKTLDENTHGLEPDERELELTTEDYYYRIRNSVKSPMEACLLLENDLEKVTNRRFPIVEDIKVKLTEAGAMGALMSGSGPSVFGIFESETTAVRAKSILDEAALGQVFVVKGISSWGVVKW